MKKIGSILKKYGFYIATGVICIGAVITIFLMPQGNVQNEANPYAHNKLTDANDLTNVPEESMINEEAENDALTTVDEDDLDTTDEVAPGSEENGKTKDETATKNQTASNTTNQETAKESESTVQESPEAVTNEKVADTEGVETKTETFESTTVNTKEPFFAEGDTFVWPVEGKVVVPYTDESTKHWFSESLNQTMRTFGICISAAEGTEVKAVARGTVTEIVDDSSTYLEAGMPYVGKLMVVDHGNGYVSVYGFQGGQINENLAGKVVEAGEVLGTVGSPKGAFIGLGDNIYLQVVHNDKVINPLNYLNLTNQEVKAEGVDLGFAK